MICLRDLIKKKENNFRYFWKGYYEYSKRIYKSWNCKSNLEENTKTNKKDKNKKIILIGTPAHGNLGDHAIAEEEKNFIKKYYQEYNIYEIIMPLYNICKNKLKNNFPEDIIIISGGGWMGNLWLHNEITIRNIIKIIIIIKS